MFTITVRLHDIAEGLRDMVGGVLDTYLSVVNNRMNDVMKTLTTITTLFMPISFLASFFGMNFFQPVSTSRGWTSNLAYIITMIIFIATPIGMYMDAQTGLDII
jgi:magnesium transporter